MFLISKDDPITRFSSAPIDELNRNENFIVALTDAGGHCEWYYSDETANGAYKRYTPQIVL